MARLEIISNLPGNQNTVLHEDGRSLVLKKMLNKQFYGQKCESNLLLFYSLRLKL